MTSLSSAEQLETKDDVPPTVTWEQSEVKGQYNLRKAKKLDGTTWFDTGC